MTELALPYQAETTLSDPIAGEESGWVERACQGDLDAFDAIMARYERRLLRFLIGLVSDPEIARELCQDTFMAAYQALPKTAGDVRLSPWLHTIALNRARSYHRRRRLRTILPLQDEHLTGQVPDMQDSVVTHDAVHRIVSRLPKQYATALLLQTGSDMTCKEIAAVVGCSEGAVKVRLMRARTAFRKLYELEEQKQCAM